MSEEESRSRIRAQIPLQEKTARADFVIENDGTFADLERAVLDFWRGLNSEET
jgi:dephospho-CoA kinase